MTYRVDDEDIPLVMGTDYDVSYQDNRNAGTATINLTGKDGFTGTWSTTFGINRVAAQVTPPTKTADYTYDGTAHALCTAGSATGGTLYYSKDDGATWTASVATATLPGNYKVCYKSALTTVTAPTVDWSPPSTKTAR